MRERMRPVRKKINNFFNGEMTIYSGGGLPIPLFRTKRKEVVRIAAAAVIFTAGLIGISKCRETQELSKPIPSPLSPIN